MASRGLEGLEVPRSGDSDAREAFDLRLKACGWTIEKHNKPGGGHQAYFLPPEVSFGVPFKNRVDYFDSRNRVVRYLLDGPAKVARELAERQRENREAAQERAVLAMEQASLGRATRDGPLNSKRTQESLYSDDHGVLLRSRGGPQRHRGGRRGDLWHLCGSRALEGGVERGWPGERARPGMVGLRRGGLNGRGAVADGAPGQTYV